MILTRDRPRELFKLVMTILGQSEYPDKLIISDNSVEENSFLESIVSNTSDIEIDFKKRNNLPAIEHYEILFKELKSIEGYTAFIHDDDYLHPRFIQCAKRMILKFPEQKILATGAYKVVKGQTKFSFPKGSRYSQINFTQLLESYITCENPVFPGYFYHNSILQLASEILIQNHARFRKYVDLVLIGNLVHEFGLVLSNTPTYYYNFHGNNDSSKNDFFARLEIVKYFKSKNVKPELIAQYRLFNIIEERKFLNKGFSRKIALILSKNLNPSSKSSVAQYFRYFWKTKLIVSYKEP